MWVEINNRGIKEWLRDANTRCKAFEMPLGCTKGLLFTLDKLVGKEEYVLDVRPDGDNPAIYPLAQREGTDISLQALFDEAIAVTNAKNPEYRTICKITVLLNTLEKSLAGEEKRAFALETFWTSKSMTGFAGPGIGTRDWAE